MSTALPGGSAPPAPSGPRPPSGGDPGEVPLFSELKSILRHSFLYGLANWVRPLLSLLLLPLYIKRLSVEQYGDYGLFVQTTEFIGLLIGMRFDLTLTRLYFERKDDAARSRVVFTAFAWLVGLAAGGAAIGALVAPSLVTLVFAKSATGGSSLDPDLYAHYFRLSFVTLFFQLAAQVPSAYARILKKSAFFSAVSVLALILGLTLNIWFVAGLDLNLLGIFYSGLAVNAFLFVVLGLFMAKSVRPSLSLHDWRDLNRMSLPLLPGSIAVFVLTFGDQFIINYLQGREGVGVYRVAYKFGLLVSYVVTQPFMQFWRVRMYEIYERGRAEKAYRKVLTLFAFLIVFVALVLSVSIHDVFRIIEAEPDWLRAAPLVPVLAAAYVFAGMRYHVEVGIFLMKKTRLASYVTVSAAILNVGLNFVLVPPLGAMGAALATLASFVYMLLLSYFYSNRLFHVNYEFGRISKSLIAALFLFTVATSVQLDSPFLSLVFRLLVALSYPFILYFMRFYREEEMRRAKDVLNRLLGNGAGAGAR